LWNLSHAVSDEPSVREEAIVVLDRTCERLDAVLASARTRERADLSAEATDAQERPRPCYCSARSFGSRWCPCSIGSCKGAHQPSPDNARPHDFRGPQQDHLADEDANRAERLFDAFNIEDLDFGRPGLLIVTIR
jgi:hypothetical protein